ncbi:hypothetical protein [Nitrospirillum amazonense]|nr:hypothetical protein [Nitrospirillum amazonense]
MAMLAALRDVAAKGVSMPEGVRMDDSAARAAVADIAANLEVPPALKAKAQELREQVRMHQISPEEARSVLTALIQEYQIDASAAAAGEESTRKEMARSQRALYASDSVYRAAADGLRTEADTRLAALDKNEERLQAMAKERGITIPDDGRMAALRKAYEEAKRDNNDEAVHALETQMHELEEQRAKAAAALLHKAGRDDLAGEAEGIAGAQKDGFEAALKGYDEWSRKFLEAEKRQGKLTPEKLKQHEEELAKEREALVKNRDTKSAAEGGLQYRDKTTDLLSQLVNPPSPSGAAAGDQEKPASAAAATSPTMVQTPAPLVIHLEEPAVKFDMAEANHVDQKVPTTITVAEVTNSARPGRGSV